MPFSDFHSEARGLDSLSLFLVDGVGPFFRGLQQKRINWSKIPFHHLETDQGLDLHRFGRIQEDFRAFAERVAGLGFNAVTLDDVAHLVDHESYEPELRRLIGQYREQYAKLFQSAADAGLQVFLTTDLMFFNPALEESLGQNPDEIIAFLDRAFEQLFRDFPQLGGLIMRFGESDGLDVRGHFKSRLVVRSPRQAKRYLEGLLPVFERNQKLLVFRTWSVGAYSIGDLIWNRDTFDRTFRHLDSPSLVISMKPGESDFFRFLPLSKLFRRSAHQKIFEIQARREYEGCGEYPSFIGWDLETYRRELENTRGVIGVSVWCQTGGWTKFRRLTYLEGSSIDGSTAEQVSANPLSPERSSVWNELNTEVAIDLFKKGSTVEQAIHNAYHRRFGTGQAPSPEEETEAEAGAPRLIELLRLSDEVIRELLYIDDFARQKVFFRRSRIPPLLSVYWDRVLVNHSMRQLMRCFVDDGPAKIEQGRQAVEKIRRMIELADEIGLEKEGLEFQLATFEILAAVREYYFGEYDPALAKRLRKMRKRYKKTVRKPRYTLSLDFSPLGLRRVHLRWILAFLLRKQRGYRLIDQIITVRLLAMVYPVIRRFEHRLVPAFARKQAMGIDSIFR